MLKNICVVIVLLFSFASLALAQGAAPVPPFVGWWDARWSGVKANDSVTDQTSAFNVAADKARDLLRALFVPEGVYNAGLTLDSTNDGLTIIFGGDVKIKQTWHLTGNGPDLDVSDPNYNATQTGYVENVSLLGTLTLGSGGRVGTFYCRNVKIENIIGEDSCAGVHIYSHSEDVSIDKVYIKGTKLDAGITGGVWIDKYTGGPAVTSMPKNINIGSIHVVRAHYNGVYIAHAKDIRIGDIRVDTAGLNGLRITGNASERIAIGSVSVNKCGANTTNNTSEELHSGICIDGSCSRITIQSAVVRNSWERGLIVTNGVRGLDIGTLVSDSNAINDSGISYSVRIEGTGTENISLKRCVIKNARVVDSSYGLSISDAKNVTVGDLAVRGGFKLGFHGAGVADNINVGSSHFVLDSIGVQLASSRDGHYNFESIMVDSCRSYGLFLTGLNDSSSVSVGSLVAQGDIAEAFRSGIYMSNADGAVSIARAHIRGYDTTNARGFQVANNNDGKIRIDHLIVENCATGIYWDTVGNDGFSFGVIDLKGNTNDYSTGAQRLLADADVHFGVVDDTARFGRFPYVNTTPSDNFIWKFDAADSTWKLEADDGNDTLWSILSTPGNRTAIVYVGDKATNDTLIGIVNSSTVTQLDARTNASFEFLDDVSMTTKKIKTNTLDLVSGGAMLVGLTNGDRMYYNFNAPDSLIPHIRLVRTTINDSLTAYALWRQKTSRDTIAYIGVSDTLIKIKDSASTTIINAAGQALKLVGTGITLSGGSVINKLIDSTEVTNAADNGPGWFNYQWGVVDSARVTQPREGGDAFDGMVPKYKKRPSATAPDSTRYGIPVETSADVAVGAIDLATDVAGTLPVGNGGTGVANPTVNLIYVGNGSNAMASVANGTTGQVLGANTGAAPTFQNNVGASVDLTTEVGATILPIANGGTNASATPPTNGVLYFDGTRYVGLTNGTTGQVLNANTGLAPSWGAGGGGGGGTAKGRISVWDATELDDSGAVTTGSGIGSAINLVPSPNTINLWVDPDGVSVDTTGGKVKVPTGGIDSTELAANAVDSAEIKNSIIGGSKMAYRYVEYGLPVAHVRNNIITDSLTLSLPTFGSNTGTFLADTIFMTSLFVDSSSQGSDRDWALVTGCIPEDIIVDSIVVSYRTTSSEAVTTSAAVAEIDSVAYMFRTGTRTSTKDQNYHQQFGTITRVNTNWVSTTTTTNPEGWTIGAIAITATAITAGTEVKVVFANNLTGAQSAVWVDWVHVCGKKR